MLMPRFDFLRKATNSLTTAKQPLVTKKNRKVRRLREIYPEVNIKVLYAADYRKLIEKFAGSGSFQEDGVA